MGKSRHICALFLFSRDGMLFWGLGSVVLGILIYSRWGAIYIKWQAVCGRARRQGNQFSGSAGMAVPRVASLGLVGGIQA